MAKFRFTPRASNIRARLALDPRSLREFEAALERLKMAARKEAVMNALAAGGGVLRDAAESRAPGPHIACEVMTGSQLARGWKKASAAGVKPEALYAVIGPEEKFWYYRFAEYGTKAHGVSRRKRTRYQQYASKNRMKRSTLKSYRTGQGRSVSRMKPVMVWMEGSRLIFARKVRGQPAKPFLRPAVDAQGNTAMVRVGQMLAMEIEKVARG